VSEDELPQVAGRIGSAYGIRGWVHVKSFLEPPELLFELDALWLETKTSWEPMSVSTTRAHGKGFVVKLDGISDRTQAELLRGATIGVLRADLPGTEDGEYYWEDLLGLVVVNEQDIELGRVSGFMETGANDVMVLDGERQRMLPFALGSVVRDVNLEAGEVRVDWHPDD
jgi:16S rRNA processing protein RimM